MSSTTIATIEKMLETLPDDVQERVVEHLREYILDLQDELRWAALFESTQEQLVALAQRVHQDIESGLTEPMDFERL